MYNKKFLVILVIFSLIFSVGVVSASELNETSYLGESENTIILTDLNQQEMNKEIIRSSEDNSWDIYVDELGDGVNGNGTKENPFTTLDSSCESVKEYKEKVTVNIYDGNYTIGSELKFNTSNLHINAVGNNVIIKNLHDMDNIKQSFGLTEEGNGNFTMSNVIFDGSGWTRSNSLNQFFTPFSNGNDNLVKFDNCTFIGFESTKNQARTILPQSTKTVNTNNVYEFTNCKLINYTTASTRGIGIAYGCNVIFVNCIFSAEYSEGIGMNNANTVVFDSCWFGYNEFNDNRMFTAKNTISGAITNRPGITKGIYQFTRYAIFDVSENYLGGNVYEIVGKLMWNDTTTDNIDKLGPMTVHLSADNGDIPKTATLENGIFKVNYITESDSHEITAVLDHQIIKLNNNINFTLNSPSIQYGENQNITVTFQNNVNGTVYVTVNNKTYKVYLDDKNVAVISIEDKLPKGTHDVNVKFESDSENYVNNLGFNTTTISVLGISSSLTVPPLTINYNDTKKLIATLTDINGNILVNKTVNIVVGSINENLTTDDDGQVSVDVSSLMPYSYVARISFAGDEGYDESNTSVNVIVNKLVPDVVISYGDLIPGEKLIINVKVSYAAENITIIVNGDKNSTKLVDNVATYTIDELAQGTYYVTVLYAGDELCDFAYKTDTFNVVKSTTDLIKELNENITDKDAKIGELNQTVADKDAVIGELNQSVADKDAVIGELNQSVADKDAVIGELNQTVVDKDAVIGELNQTVVDKDAVIGELNQTVVDKDAVIGELNQTVVDKDAVIGELNQTVVDKDAVIGELNQTVVDKDAVIGELNQTVVDKDAVIGELNQTVVDKDAVIGELNQTVVDKDAVIGELNQTVVDKDAVIGELNQNVTAKDAEITNLNNNLTEKDNIITGKEAEITILNDNAKTMNNTIKSQTKEINNLNATVIAQNKTMEKSLNPVATSILVKNIRTVATSAKYFIISLVDANNVPLANKTVKFTVNGKTKSVVTNGSGIARVKVIYNVAGTRFYTFSFLGENGYSASIASAKVVVIKKATKLAVSKKATTKTKKVQVKLTTGKTVLKYKQVILKIKGKTYTVKTNKKGIATFKIAGLIKGTFKYTVKFAGDKTYKTTSKNGRITVY